MKYALWTLQALLALVFVLAGAMKLVVPTDVLAAQMSYPLPGLFIRFIGLIEVLGGLGLLLPALSGIRPALTPLAAALLAVEMIVACIFTLATAAAVLVVLPLVLALLSAFVAYGRVRLAPHHSRGARARARGDCMKATRRDWIGLGVLALPYSWRSWT